MPINNILCTICARSGSKGIKNKNFILVNNKPLISYTINQAKLSKIFDDIVLSSDSDQIVNIAKKNKIEIFFKRKSILSSGKSGKIEVIRDALLESEKYYNKKYDYIIDLDVTSPLRSVDDIKNAFNLFLQKNYDILFSVSDSRKNPYFNLVEVKNSGQIKLVKTRNSKFLRRQDAPKCYDMNASIYIWRRSALLKYKSLFVKNTGIYIMPEERSIDIDTPLDLEIVSFLLRKKKYD